jgi:Concanavalin A-like lectin/glucanases superfamily
MTRSIDAYTHSDKTSERGHYMSKHRNGSRILGTLLASLLFAGTAVASTSYKTSITNNRPVAYWLMGETSGTVAQPAMGGYQGTYQGSPQLGQAGILPGEATTKSPKFDGVNDRIVANGVSTRTSWPGLTLEIWVEVTQTNAEEHAIVFSAPKGGYAPAILRDEPSNKFKYRDGQTSVLSKTTPQVGHTYYVVATIDGSNNGKLYVNGVSEGTFHSTANPQKNGLFTIGADYDCHGCTTPTTTSFWHGRIGEAAVYDYALSSSAITAHYQAGL